MLSAAADSQNGHHRRQRHQFAALAVKWLFFQSSIAEGYAEQVAVVEEASTGSDVEMAAAGTSES